LHVGFVFQSFRLLTGLTAEENIRMSLSMRGIRHNAKLARKALDAVGLADKGHLKSNELSGGEKQRVAVARALAHEPDIVFADEPTASLDSTNGARVSELLAECVSRDGRFLLVVTHDERLRKLAKRVIRLVDGKVIEDQQT
jgi:putative ABC transport system ATP-binding protein